MQTPDQIAQRYLEGLGRSIGTGDYEDFRRMLADRSTLATNLGERADRTETEIQHAFGRIRWFFTSKRINRVERRLVSVLSIDAERFVAVHQTRFYRNDLLLQEPVKALTTYVKDGDAWRVTDTCYNIPNSMSHHRALLGPGPLPAGRRTA